MFKLTFGDSRHKCNVKQKNYGKKETSKQTKNTIKSRNPIRKVG
jgi:hypothetical protein